MYFKTVLWRSWYKVCDVRDALIRLLFPDAFIALLESGTVNAYTKKGFLKDSKESGRM